MAPPVRMFLALFIYVLRLSAKHRNLHPTIHSSEHHSGSDSILHYIEETIYALKKRVGNEWTHVGVDEGSAW